MKTFGFPQIHRGGGGDGGGGGGASGDAMDAMAMDMALGPIDVIGGPAEGMSGPSGVEGFGYSDPGAFGGGSADNFSDPGQLGAHAYTAGLGFGLDQQTFSPSNFADRGFPVWGMRSAAPNVDIVNWDQFNAIDAAAPGSVANNYSPRDSFAGRFVGAGMGPIQGWMSPFDIPTNTPSQPTTVASPGSFPGSHSEPFAPHTPSTPPEAVPTTAPSAPSMTPGFTNAQVGAPTGWGVGNMSFGGDPGGRLDYTPGAGNVAAPTSVGDFGYILPNGQWQHDMPQGGAYAFMDPTGQWSRYNTPNSPHSDPITPWPNDPNTPSAQDFAMNAPSSYLIGQGYKYHDPASGPAPRQFAPGERINAAGANIYGDWDGGYFYKG